MKRSGLHVLKIVVSVGLVALLLWRADLAELGSVLARTDIGLAFATIAVAHLDRFLQAGKWWLLLRAAGARFALGAAIANTYSGNFAGQFLPSGVGGDFVRVALLRTSGIPMPEVVASIVIERVFGALALFFTAGAATLVARRIGSPVPEGMAVAVLAAFAIMLVAVAMSFRFGIDGLIRWVARVGARFRLGEHLATLADAYRRYGKRKLAVFTYFALSILEVLLMTAIFALVAWTLGVRASYPVMAIAVPVTLFIQRLPISINGIGVQEGVLSGLLVAAGWDLSEALALAVALRILDLFVLAPGAVLWMGARRRAASPAAATPHEPR